MCANTHALHTSNQTNSPTKENSHTFNRFACFLASFSLAVFKLSILIYMILLGVFFFLLFILQRWKMLCVVYAQAFVFLPYSFTSSLKSPTTVCRRLLFKIFFALTRELHSIFIFIMNRREKKANSKLWLGKKVEWSLL